MNILIETKKLNFEQKKEIQRQRLLEKLKLAEDEDIIVKGKPKRNLKTFHAQHEDFRGSRYRGVSKNKGKWQVRIF